MIVFRGQLFRVTREFFSWEAAFKIPITLDVGTYGCLHCEWIGVVPSRFGLHLNRFVPIKRVDVQSGSSPSAHYIWSCLQQFEISGTVPSRSCSTSIGSRPLLYCPAEGDLAALHLVPRLTANKAWFLGKKKIKVCIRRAQRTGAGKWRYWSGERSSICKRRDERVVAGKNARRWQASLSGRTRRSRNGL